MSYTKELKLSLLHVNTKKCCGLSELEALLHTGGELSISGGRPGIDFTTELEPLAGRVLSLIRELTGAEPRMLMRRKNQPRRMTLYVIELDGDKTQTVFEKFGRDGVLSEIRLPEKECCLRAALRGAFLGCGMLAVENVRVVREVRNRINRQNNCESANMDKSITASLRTMEDIELILSSGRKVSSALMEAAQMRAERPEASLSELALELGISRSALNNRLRKLRSIAEEIRMNQ